MEHTILIVEDEVKISRFVELELKYEGYKVEKAFDGREGLEKALMPNINLILLDIMLPNMSGVEVLRRIRMHSDVPVIMLTAKDDVTDKVMGLDLGADDYITKPFEIEELLARIRVCLRKNPPKDELSKDILSSGKLSVDIKKRQVKYLVEEIELTKKEFDFLVYLIQNKGIALSRDQILENVWGYEYIGDTNVVDVYVRYLRSKIDNRFDTKFIHTVRGIGYTLKDEK